MGLVLQPKAWPGGKTVDRLCPFGLKGDHGGF